MGMLQNRQAGAQLDSAQISENRHEQSNCKTHTSSPPARSPIGKAAARRVPEHPP